MLSAGQKDENGNFKDNKNLNLSTKTLSYENSSNTKYSSNTGSSLGVSLSLKEEKNDKKTKTNLSSINSSISKSLNLEKTKTLASLGQGNINIIDKENSDDLALLNRDIKNTKKDLFKTDTKTSVDASLDTRVLTEDGRKQIKEDLLKTKMIGDTIKQIATNKTVEIDEFFSNTNKENKTYEAIKKKIASDPILAAKLNDKTLSDVDKEQMMNEITQTVQKELGYTTTENKLIASNEKGRDGKDIKGYYSKQTQNSYINEENIENGNEGLVTVAGTEMQRAIDHQEKGDKAFTESKSYRADRAKFSQNVGKNITNYTNFALDYTNQGSMATISNTRNRASTVKSVSSEPSIFNTSIANNNAEFKGLDKEQGDNFVQTIPFIFATSSYLNAPTKDKAEEVKSGPTNAAYLLPLGGAKLLYNGSKTVLTTTGKVLSKTNPLVLGGTVSGGVNIYDQNKRNNGNLNLENLNKTEFLLNTATGAYAGSAKTFVGAVVKGSTASSVNETYNQVVNVTDNSIQEKAIEVSKKTLSGAAFGSVISVAGHLGKNVTKKVGIINKPIKQNINPTYKQTVEGITGITTSVLPKIIDEEDRKNE